MAFGETLKINKKSNFDWNQLKHAQNRTAVCIKNYKNGEFSPSHFWKISQYK